MLHRTCARAIHWLEPLLDARETRRGNRIFKPQSPGFYLRLGPLYCDVSEKEKALAAYQRGYNVGDAEAKEIMARLCP